MTIERALEILEESNRNWKVIQAAEGPGYEGYLYGPDGTTISYKQTGDRKARVVLALAECLDWQGEV